MLEKIKKLFDFSVNELITVVLEAILIGILQLIFSYGSVVLLASIYIIARFHKLSRKGVAKILEM